MPRDVVIGEGYEGDTMIALYSPGRHNGEFEYDATGTVLLTEGMADLGDVAASFAALVASKELDKLRDGLFKVQDSLRQIIDARNVIYNAYLKANEIYREALRLFGPVNIPGPSPGIGLPPVLMPNPRVIPALTALQTAVEGVKLFARQVHQTEQVVIVYMKIHEALSRAGMRTDANMVLTGINNVNRFVYETDRIFANVPQYNETKMKLIAAARNERVAWRVPETAYDDPRWYQAYLKAADSIVPLPKTAGVSGMNGLGDLGSPVALVAAIALVIIAVGAAVALIVAAAKMAPDANLKAEAARDIWLAQIEREKAVEVEMRRQGKPEPEIQARITELREETRKKIHELPTPKPPVELPIGSLALIAAGALAIFALTR